MNKTDLVMLTNRLTSMWMLLSTTCVDLVAEQEPTLHVEAGLMLAKKTSPVSRILTWTSMTINARLGVVKLRTMVIYIR